MIKGIIPASSTCQADNSALLKKEGGTIDAPSDSMYEVIYYLSLVYLIEIILILSNLNNMLLPVMLINSH